MIAADEADCKHGDYFWSCPPCQRGDEPINTYARDEQKYGAAMNARYEGTCHGCLSKITLGERIVLAADGWKHITC